MHGKGQTTVRHVLTHRAGVPQMPDGVTPERMCDRDWMTAAIAQLKPLAVAVCHNKMFIASNLGAAPILPCAQAVVRQALSL